MQNVSELRAHIAAIEQTRKITNAMQLVSTSRLKRVMQHIAYNERYFQRVQSMMRDILELSAGWQHPYLTRREGKRRTLIVVAGDKGMAGAYNANVLSLAMEELRDPAYDNSLISVGLVANDYFTHHGIEPDIELMGTIQDPSLANARRICLDVFNLYDQALTDEVCMIYTAFYGEEKNKPRLRRLLPIQLSDYADVESSPHGENMIYEPSPRDLFDHLVPQYVIGIVFGALVQAYASEHFARMNAMESATKNADEMLQKLKMQYNLARQAAITQEITEIAGAVEAQSGAGGGR